MRRRQAIPRPPRRSDIRALLELYALGRGSEESPLETEESSESLRIPQSHPAGAQDGGGTDPDVAVCLFPGGRSATGGTKNAEQGVGVGSRISALIGSRFDERPRGGLVMAETDKIDKTADHGMSPRPPANSPEMQRLKNRTPFERARDEPKSLRLAIVAKCRDCQRGDADPDWRGRVTKCHIEDCPLWHVRPQWKGIQRESRGDRS